MGLEAKTGVVGKKIVGREDGKIIVEEEIPGSKKGEKRKFELDEDELLRIAQEERTKARKTIDDEKVCVIVTLDTSIINDITGIKDYPPFLLGAFDNTFF